MLPHRHNDLHWIRRLMDILRSLHEGYHTYLMFPMPDGSAPGPVSITRNFRLNLRCAVVVVRSASVPRPTFKLTTEGIQAMSEDVLPRKEQVSLMRTSSHKCQMDVGNKTHDGSRTIILPRGWQRIRFCQSSVMSVLEHRRLCWVIGRGGISYTVVNLNVNTDDMVHQCAAQHDRPEDDADYASDLFGLMKDPPLVVAPACELRGGAKRVSSWWNKEDAVWPRAHHDSCAVITRMREQALLTYTAFCVEMLDSLKNRCEAELAVADALISELSQSP